MKWSRSRSSARRVTSVMYGIRLQWAPPLGCIFIRHDSRVRKINININFSILVVYLLCFSLLKLFLLYYIRLCDNIHI